MKYKQVVYTLFFLFVVTTASGEHDKGRGFAYNVFNYGTKLEKVSSGWNRTLTTEPTTDKHWQNYQTESSNKPHEEFYENEAFSKNFPDELTKCIGDHQYQITENYSQGKNIILNCFKATLILNLIRYLGTSPRSSIKLLNGLVELKKIPSRGCREGVNGVKKCDGKYGRHFDHLANSGLSQEKREKYIKMYKKAMEKLVNEKMKFSSLRNITEEEKANQWNRINEGSQAFLSEVLRNLGDERAEKVEEEKIKKDISDPRLLNVLDIFSKNYMMKVRFYPGVSARMMRSGNGGVTFDLELNEAAEEVEEGDEEEEEEEDASTREVKALKKEGKDYIDDDNYYNNNDQGNKKKKKGKRKRKEGKKKVKKVKKILPYLLIPILIQLTLLPFVFKKLFFLAMKALFAGKVALILIGFNILRNTCINQEDRYAQRIRVEHYGYNKGEEYGAWINGRSLKEPEVADAMSELPFPAHKPSSVSSSS